MSGVRAARTAEAEQEKSRVAATKVKRYWPGKAPDWADGDDAPAPGDALRTDVAAPVIVRRADDPRLARLQQTRGVDREEAIQRHREIRAAEIVRRVRVRDEEEGEERQEKKGGEAAASSSEVGGGLAAGACARAGLPAASPHRARA
jgi:microfibrillar-associated protein 1